MRKTTIFTTSFEGGFHEWDSLDRWFAEQRNFDSAADCLDILETLFREERTVAGGVEYRLVDPEEFAQQLAALSARVVWEEGLDRSYLFAAA